MVVLPLAAADDLAVSLGREHVVALHRAGIVRVFLHVEGLDPLRIVEHEERPVPALDEERLRRGAEIRTPFDVAPLRLQEGDGVGVADPVERRLDGLEFRDVTAQRLELIALVEEDALHDPADEALLEFHVPLGVDPGGFGFHHPELGQVAARLRLLGPEGGAEAVHLAERRRGGLHIKLPRLREVRGAEIEVLGLEEGARRFADGAGEDGSVDVNEPLVVEEVVDRPDDLVPDAHDRDLPRAPQPQVAVLEEEIDAVLLGLDRKVGRRAQDFEVRPGEFDAGGRAGIGAHEPRHGDARLVPHGGQRLPHLGRDLVAHEDALDLVRAVAKHEKGDLAAGAEAPNPSAEADFLPDAGGQFAYGDGVFRHVRRQVAAPFGTGQTQPPGRRPGQPTW